VTFSEDLKSIDETAVVRNWPPKRVRKLIAEGLPTVRIGRQRFINSDTLDEFLKARETSASDAGTSNQVENEGRQDRGGSV
jgi:hypothetical protein